MPPLNVPVLRELYTDTGRRVLLKLRPATTQKFPITINLPNGMRAVVRCHWQRASRCDKPILTFSSFCYKKHGRPSQHTRKVEFAEWCFHKINRRRRDAGIRADETAVSLMPSPVSKISLPIPDHCQHNQKRFRSWCTFASSTTGKVAAHYIFDCIVINAL